MTIATQIGSESRWWSRNPFGFHDKIAQWATVTETFITTEYARRTPLLADEEGARLAMANIFESFTSPTFSKGELVGRRVARVTHGN